MKKWGKPLAKASLREMMSMVPGDVWGLGWEAATFHPSNVALAIPLRKGCDGDDGSLRFVADAVTLGSCQSHDLTVVVVDHAGQSIFC